MRTEFQIRQKFQLYTQIWQKCTINSFYSRIACSSYIFLLQEKLQFTSYNYAVNNFSRIYSR